MSGTNGRVVLVTGAGRRIGAAIALRLHAEGWQLAIHCSRSRDAAYALAAQLNTARANSAAVFAFDLGPPGNCAALVAAVAAHYGRLDALVNNASSYFATPLASLDSSQIDELLASNLRAPLLLIQSAVACGATAVVNLLDIHARQLPRAGFSVYTAAKAGLWTLTEALAVELAPRVRVNGVAPGHIDAEVGAVPSLAEQTDLDDKARQLPRVPLGRFGAPEEVAAAVAWLLSADAAYITGAVIPVDGGRRLA